MAAAVPVVEITHDGHGLRVGGPDDEGVAGLAVDRGRARAHFAPRLEPAALAKQMRLEFRDKSRHCRVQSESTPRSPETTSGVVSQKGNCSFPFGAKRLPRSFPAAA